MVLHGFLRDAFPNPLLTLPCARQVPRQSDRISSERIRCHKRASENAMDNSEGAMASLENVNPTEIRE